MGSTKTCESANRKKPRKKYNYVRYFVSKAELEEFAAMNRWSKRNEKKRRRKGGTTLLFYCRETRQRGGHCRHRMLAIQRPEGCYVAKTTDSGLPHPHRVKRRNAENDKHQQISRGHFENQPEMNLNDEQLKVNDAERGGFEEAATQCAKAYIAVPPAAGGCESVAVVEGTARAKPSSMFFEKPDVLNLVNNDTHRCVDKKSLYCFNAPTAKRLEKPPFYCFERTQASQQSNALNETYAVRKPRVVLGEEESFCGNGGACDDDDDEDRAAGSSEGRLRRGMASVAQMINVQNEFERPRNSLGKLGVAGIDRRNWSAHRPYDTNKTTNDRLIITPSGRGHSYVATRKEGGWRASEERREDSTSSAPEISDEPLTEDAHRTDPCSANEQLAAEVFAALDCRLQRRLLSIYSTADE